jgi:hypothetical protein
MQFYSQVGSAASPDMLKFESDSFLGQIRLPPRLDVYRDLE